MIQKELGEYIRKEWVKFGMDKVELRKYNILLSFPEKPGSVSLVHANGSEVFKSAPQEEFLIPEENNSNVVPPFNAYSPNGTVRVRKQHPSTPPTHTHTHTLKLSPMHTRPLSKIMKLHLVK